MSVINYLFLYSLASIWLLLLFNIFLTLSGYIFSVKNTKKKVDILKQMKNFPAVSVLIPAHNEEKVIDKTIRSILNLHYPKDKLEIVVVNDHSSDQTEKIIKEIIREFPRRNIQLITTDKDNGGKGKSNALNIAYQQSTGEYIVVYDADNTPEKLSLRYLVHHITNSKELGAVIGKFRTRNKNKNWLTRFINIETLSFQWMSQAGRWQLFKLCTIPGTNFIIRRSVIERIGGWDVDALSEDTEISFQIYKLGYKIGFMPLAVTWEQEPEKLSVWFKQRTRWVVGNIYVLHKYIKKMLKGLGINIIFDLFYFFSVYFLFLSSVIISDVIFLIGLFTDIKILIPGNFIILWFLGYILFILEVSIALSIEKGESSLKNIALVAIMYFTYAQLWIIVAIKGLISYFRILNTTKSYKWYKTERF